MQRVFQIAEKALEDNKVLNEENIALLRENMELLKEIETLRFLLSKRPDIKKQPVSKYSLFSHTKATLSAREIIYPKKQIAPLRFK